MNHKPVIGRQCGLLLLLLPVLPLAAQPEPDSFAPYRLDEVLVVAARVPLTQSATALSSSRFDSLDLERRGGAGVADLLRSEAGAEVRSYTGGPGLATIGLWGASSQQTLVLIDGLPVTNAFSGLTDLGLVAAGFLDRIEVVRGAGSSLYGANALGGIVDLRSVAPADLAETGTLQRILVQAGLPWQNALSYLGGSKLAGIGVLGGIASSAGNGYRSNSGHTGANAMVGIGTRQGELLEWNLFASYAERDLGLPGPQPHPDSIPRYGDSTATSLHDRESDLVWAARGSLTWRPRVSDRTRLDLVLRPDLSETRTEYRMLSQWAPSDSDVTIDDYRSRTAGISAIAGFEMNGRSRALIGYDVRYDQGRVKTGWDGSEWSGSAVNHGVWTEAILRPVQRLTLQASLRSDMNPDYGLHWSPGLGLAWQLLPGLKLRGSAGTGFRAPTLSDRYWPLSGVRELEPERGWAAQIGTDAYSEKFDFSATGFLRRVREMISWLPDTGLIWRPTNVDEVRIGGLELSGRIRPYPGLEFGFAVTGLEGSQIRQEQINWAVPEFVRAERFPASLPSLRVNLSARHEFRFGLHLGARARICDERFNYYPEFGLDSLIVVRVKRLAPYSVLDLELGQTLFREFRLVLRAENLLDAKYAEQFGTSRSDRDYPMPGRTFSLAIRFEHGR